MWFPEKVFCWLVMSHIGWFLNIFARECTELQRGLEITFVLVSTAWTRCTWQKYGGISPINGSWLTNKGILIYINYETIHFLFVCFGFSGFFPLFLKIEDTLQILKNITVYIQDLMINVNFLFRLNVLH